MMINSVPCVNETKVNGRPVLWPPTKTFLGPRHAFLETKAFSVNAFHNLVINAQPRPQGAFPWLWRWAPHLQSQGKTPWGRGCAFQLLFNTKQTLARIT